ncbi:MAG: hypothetical protein LBV27_05485 [Oscillospiraceae bacterium]|jgi:hypothetical protein|nr:hypothetical protein [Oscillospiraceae bacterium]
MLKRHKRPLLFAAAMVPIAAIGGVFTIIYTLNGYEPSARPSRTYSGANNCCRCVNMSYATGIGRFAARGIAAYLKIA